MATKTDDPKFNPDFVPKDDDGDDTANKTNKPAKVAPPPLPVNIDYWVRRAKLHRTLNDQVEELHLAIMRSGEDIEGYVALLQAVHDAHAVEGSCSADNLLAAMRIREAATAAKSPVSKEKLAVISHSLNIVMKRWGVSRKQRCNSVAGQSVPTGNSNDDSE